LNLVTGLVRPTQGTITVDGIPVTEAERIFRTVGYCTQYDAFPRGLTGIDFVRGYLAVHGLDRRRAHALACEAIEKVGLLDAAERRVASYSKGMRQRLRLAQAIAHRPRVLILDEPLNGLDPMARAEVIALFRAAADEGCVVLISSHILHEVDVISDSVILMNHGYVVAEGDIHDVRQEVEEHPFKILVRCDRPALLAARFFSGATNGSAGAATGGPGGQGRGEPAGGDRPPREQTDHAVEVKIHADGGGLVATTRDAGAFYRLLNRLAADAELAIETVQPADDDVQSLYDYLIGREGGQG
jgi:ABC-2 type transport system ATP-binding protein